MFHIPPGIDGYGSVHNHESSCAANIVPMWVPEWTVKFDSLLLNYQGTIAASFAGHTHTDDFRVIRDGSDAKAFVLIDPPISPVYDQNPAFRVFDVSGSEVRDQTTYYLTNLTTAGAKQRGKWKKEYTFSREWKTKQLDSASSGQDLRPDRDHRCRARTLAEAVQRVQQRGEGRSRTRCADCIARSKGWAWARMEIARAGVRSNLSSCCHPERGRPALATECEGYAFHSAQCRCSSSGTADPLDCARLRLAALRMTTRRKRCSGSPYAFALSASSGKSSRFSTSSSRQSGASSWRALLSIGCTSGKRFRIQGRVQLRDLTPRGKHRALHRANRRVVSIQRAAKLRAEILEMAGHRAQPLIQCLAGFNEFASALFHVSADSIRKPLPSAEQ